MIWNRHPKLEGTHAFLSASKYSWLYKNDVDIVEAYKNSYAQTIGTMMHSFAADCIGFREKLRKGDMRLVKLDLMRKGVPEFVIDLRDSFPTLMRYVNDAVDFQMDQEVLLYYSDYCYGTVDAISVTKDILRIHDLKTGVTPAKMDQLLIYSALFYLEYGYKPEAMHTELRIYQMDDIVAHTPEPEEVREVMEAIVRADRVLQKLKEV